MKLIKQNQLAILIICTVISATLIITLVHDPHLVSHRRANIEFLSIDRFENFIDSFRDENNIIRFHENYAGAYLDNAGQLVIMISPASHTETLEPDEFRDISQEFAERAGLRSTSDIIFKEASFSHSYLTNLIAKFNESLLDALENPDNTDSIWNYVTAIILIDNENLISIEIYYLDDMKIERFREEASDSPAVVFRRSRNQNIASQSYGLVAETDLRPGMMASTGSMGFRARMGDYHGFVTAGHNAQTGSPVFRIHQIGTCIISIVDSRLDGAFVKSYYEILDVTFAGNRISGINTFPLHGASIFQEGRATGVTMGHIRSTNATHQYFLHRGHVTVTRTNLIVGDYFSAVNDSGGIVYDIYGRVLGIHLAGPIYATHGDRLVESVVTIQNVLGVEAY